MERGDDPHSQTKPVQPKPAAGGAAVNQIEPEEAALATPLSLIKGIGPRTAESLAELGLNNVGKLIAHLPTRHERQEAETTIGELTADRIVSARGEVTATRLVRGRAPRFEAVLIDGTGRLDLTWFNQTYLAKRIKPGMHLRVQGTAKKYGPGLQMANATFEAIDPEREPPDARGARLRSVYPASETISSKQIEKAVAVILPRAVALIEDHLSAEFCRERNMPTLAEAYRLIHAPEAEGDAIAARRRLAYDELLMLQLGVQMKRAHLRRSLAAPALRHTPAIDRHIRERFPFTLTAAQDKVVAEIARDLASGTPTNRLVQGDVGSGKTVVALYAMLMAIASGHQAALMAPTEILAEQHFRTISGVLEGSKVRLALLTSSTPGAERSETLTRLADGNLDLIIGTHALLTESVVFHSLAVAVIDEQHRFGVHQRSMLRSKGAKEAKGGREMTPHVIVMTATPIPRTLAITLFGDLDISTITGLPPGRKPVATRVVSDLQRPVVYDFLRARVDQGQQAYVVVPAIDGGTGGVGGTGEVGGVGTDRTQAPPPPDARLAPIASVRSLMKELEEGPLAGRRLAALHGRLKRATREAIMERFRAGAIDVLVATTVIEVGVDVPNATVMVVEHAERFGLAQLHQLRGRIGRGEKESACVLVADSKLGNVGEIGQRRLEVMASVSDGFVLAEKDFEIRGFGELFGTRQSGLPPFKVADLTRDRELLLLAKRDATAWIDRSPTLSAAGEATLRRRLMKAHGESLGLADVG